MSCIALHEVSLPHPFSSERSQVPGRWPCSSTEAPLSHSVSRCGSSTVLAQHMVPAGAQWISWEEERQWTRTLAFICGQLKSLKSTASRGRPSLPLETVSWENCLIFYFAIFCAEPCPKVTKHRGCASCNRLSVL